MLQSPAELEAAGLEVVDLSDERAYALRPIRPRDASTQLEGLRRIAAVFLEKPEAVLQELVEAAVRLCGADSAGISIEREDRTDADYYKWVATAGVYTPFLHASLPRVPSACSVCLERDAPQLFRVDTRFFDLLGIEAATVRDGILLPWQVEDTRGTIFVISHTREQAFDQEDLHFMQVLANFVALGMRQLTDRKKLLQQAAATAAANMANELAHQINNPLQSLTNTLYLAKQNSGVGDERTLALRLEDDFARLNALAKRLLELPFATLERKASAPPAPATGC